MRICKPLAYGHLQLVQTTDLEMHHSMCDMDEVA